jgi:hypothetical protein
VKDATNQVKLAGVAVKFPVGGLNEAAAQLSPAGVRAKV